MTTTRTVDDAIKTLSACLTYDPRERWIAAYAFLEDTRKTIYRALRPAAAMEVVAFLALLPLSFIALNRSDLAGWWLWSFAVLCVPSLAAIAARFFIEQRMPIVRQLPAIEDALKPFREVASALEPSRQ